MTTTPAISIVMANYNGAQFLSAAIGSLQSQTFTNWELVLVDDASTDDSVPLARSIARSDRRIVIERQDRNRGPGAARNRAIALSRGEWLAIFDSDDLMLPTRLEHLHGLASIRDAPILADNQFLFGVDASRPRKFLNDGFVGCGRSVSLAEFVASNRLYAPTPSLGYLKPFIRASLLRTLDVRYDETLQIGEDYALMVRLLSRGQSLRLASQALYLYRRHDRSVSHRISRRQILALLEADERLVREIGFLDRAEEDAFAARHRSLCTMLRYDRIVEHVKAGAYLRAAALAAGSPFTWPLLAESAGVRLRRLAQRQRGGSRRQMPRQRDSAAMPAQETGAP